MKVYAVEGWFGSDEWTERIFATEEAAEAYCSQLWIDRESVRFPGRNHALCKFGVEEYEVYG